jgi:hypothetical protein
MASGNTLCQFNASGNKPPASSYATPDTRNSVLVLDFDAASIEAAVFQGELPSNYAGGGATIDLYWMATSATSGDVKWGAAYEENDAGNNDLDADAFGTESTATGTANGTSGKVTKTTLTITHANLGSPAAGDPFRLKIRRIANDAADTMTGDAELLAVHIKES